MNRKIACMALLAFLAGSSFYVMNVSATTTPVKPKIEPASLNETLGAFIIIAGERSDHNLQNLIVGGADQVYNMLVNNLGFPASHVYYLCPVYPHPHANAQSTYANIVTAISTWASTLVDATHGLGLYLFDHGGTDIMGIVGGSLNDTQLDALLTNLQTSTSCKRDIIIYEACESGSFINTLSNHPGRIIVTSTDSFHSAYGSSTWAIFSESFWGNLVAGGTIGSAFVAGAQNVMSIGDGSVQFPLLDDDADGEGTGPLWLSFPSAPWITVPPYPVFPYGGDGYDAYNTYIHGYNGFAYVNLPWVLATAKSIWITPSANIPVWVTLPKNVTVTHVWAKLLPPYWNPPNPPDPVSNMSQLVMDNGSTSQLLELTDRTGSGNYSGQFSPNLTPWTLGVYRIAIIPEGNGTIGSIVTSTATVNANGDRPPAMRPAVMIVNPLDNHVINGSIKILAYGDDSWGLKTLQLFIDGKEVSSRTFTSFPYPVLTAPFNTTSYSNGMHQITAVATNVAGMNATQTITVDVQNSSPDYTILFYIVFLGVGFIAGVLIGLLRGYRKAGGSRIRESSTKHKYANDGGITAGDSQGYTDAQIKGETRVLKYEHKGESGFLKSTKGVAGTSNGDVIKPLKAVTKPSTGKTLKLQKGSRSLKLDKKYIKGELPEEGGE
ncbi:MAG TPA: C13 family peptidase [Candidatus Lokiarchaeia archaeon]|nr:C13 family peptidase [Candidatus Lokiarchaeia archaeon]